MAFSRRSAARIASARSAVNWFGRAASIAAINARSASSRSLFVGVVIHQR
jgi:hypothetical protein